MGQEENEICTYGILREGLDVNFDFNFHFIDKSAEADRTWLFVVHTAVQSESL